MARIINKPNTPEYEEGYDRIFRSKSEMKRIIIQQGNRTSRPSQVREDDWHEPGSRVQEEGE